ncbi:DUF3343 domain-containing protein [Agrilactobacillus yilanensis]|uniref:DUF3343 domain-containing protein n=1 Tax=Agrilactobacillus yilanensis TaxID=2485997 RepID=A0ABW4J3T4_9LACO|nr:DUF3343 domain-containing protein [Agrilactobacillus yilanensis]
MDYLFTFTNTHHAIHASDTFESKLPVRVMPLPGQLGDACGICLRVADEHLTEAKALLATADIPVQQIYQIQVVDGHKVYQKCD